MSAREVRRLARFASARALDAVLCAAAIACVTVTLAWPPFRAWFVAPLAGLVAAALSRVALTRLPVRDEDIRWRHTAAGACLAGVVTAVASLVQPIGFAQHLLPVAVLAAAWTVGPRGTIALVALLTPALVVIGAPHGLLFSVVYSIASAASAALGAWFAHLRAAASGTPDESGSSSLLRGGRGHATPSSRAEQQMMRAAHLAVGETVRRALTLLRASLRGQTAALLWVDSRTGLARVRSAETSSGETVPGPFSDRTGFLGVLRRVSEPCILNDLAHVDGFLPWYQDGVAPGHVIGLALFDEGILVGFLVIDRDRGQRPFDDIDGIALQAAAEEILAAINTERIVAEACRSRQELSFLYEAAESLNAALTPEEVCSAANAIVRRVAALDIFVITRFREEDRSQTVLHADGACVESLRDTVFPDDASLAGLAIRRQHTLPFSGHLDNPWTPIFGEKSHCPDIQSLLVIPMTMGKRVVGAFAVGSHARSAWSAEQRDQIGLIANYVAAALSNALAYSNMVQMATTDGMTGLVNHRTFKERAAEALARAQRSDRPLSLILTDIDHFKSVNDTWGHATGDVVIRAVANVLRSELRKVDIGARYGGEEFAVLLEETEQDAAAALAERLRRAAEALEFECEGKKFRISISLGVATWPRDAASLADLIEMSDQALYAAKRGGRNRVIRQDALRGRIAA